MNKLRNVSYELTVDILVLWGLYGYLWISQRLWLYSVIISIPFFVYIALLKRTLFDSRLYIAFSRAVIATFTVGCSIIALFCTCLQLLNYSMNLVELLKRVWFWASFVILVLLMQLWMRKKEVDKVSAIVINVCYGYLLLTPYLSVILGNQELTIAGAAFLVFIFRFAIEKMLPNIKQVIDIQNGIQDTHYELNSCGKRILTMVTVICSNISFAYVASPFLNSSKDEQLVLTMMICGILTCVELGAYLLCIKIFKQHPSVLDKLVKKIDDGDVISNDQDKK